MFKSLYPTRYIVSSYSIDYEDLYDKGYRGIIFDIDNTLVPHGFPADERAIELMKRLKEIGYQVLFLSNNKEARVKMFNDDVDCLYIFKANKPGRQGFVKAMEKMGTDKDNTFLCAEVTDFLEEVVLRSIVAAHLHLYSCKVRILLYNLLKFCKVVVMEWNGCTS